MFRLDRAHKARAPRSPAKFRTRLSLEPLESRIVPYSLSGDLWPHPNLVSISFVPDGTIVGVTSSGPIYSNLFATMNATFGSPSVWENQILFAAQTWAAQTNINFELVSDNGTGIGQGAYQQGDPNMGDVRIGGYNISPGVVAQTYMPPPNSNYSLAGDMQFNTAQPWSIGGNGGSAYDLYTVALHEFGHVVGLNESGVNPSAMYPYYTGVDSGLFSDDIAGVQAEYGVRSPDYFDSLVPNNTWLTATYLNPYLNSGSNTILIPNMDITTTSDVDWYVVVAPSGTTSTPQILVQSLLQSMLRPEVQVLSGGYGIGAGSVGSPLGGSLLVVNLSGITAGQLIYIEVSGETANAYGTGKYALSINFGTGPTPSVGAANTMTPNGNPLQTGYFEDDSVALAAPVSPATPAPPAVAPLQAAGLQASRVAPASSNGVLLPVLALTGPSLATSGIIAAPLAASLPTGNVLVVQPAPILYGAATDDSVALDLPAEQTVSSSVPAPVAVSAQPEQASRAVPAPAKSWSQASTAYFTADSASLEETAPTLGDGPSGPALEAALAVAGFVAVAGERRLDALDSTDEQRKRRQRS